MKTKIEIINDIELENPILVEGLHPGMGLVGKLSLDQLVKQLDTQLFAVIHSPHFSPQVDIKEDATVQLRRNEIHVHKTPDGENDLLLFTGKEQGTNTKGQYEMSEAIIEEVKKLGVEMIYTLGGYATQQMKEDPEVYGAVTHEEMKEEFKDYGVEFTKKGPIAGAAGLLLGFGKREGMKGICLMGQTHGKFVDPNSAKKVLETIEKPLDLELDYSELEEKSEEAKEAIEKIMKKQKESKSGQVPEVSESSMDYIH